MKLGHQTELKTGRNIFNSIEIEGDLHYCSSHNFIFNREIEKEKLYNAIPNFYTDIRYSDKQSMNFYKNCKLFWKRRKTISLKSCIRRTLNCKNIPVGTIVDFNKDWYFTKNSNIDNSFKFKIRKENKFEIDYEISRPEFLKQFTNCHFSSMLTSELRKNGFIVAIYKDENYNHENAIAYGHNKIIGYSSYHSELFGYTNGRDNILWDKFGNFDKWSRCEEIPKNNSIETIIEILLENE